MNYSYSGFQSRVVFPSGRDSQQQQRRNLSSTPLQHHAPAPAILLNPPHHRTGSGCNRAMGESTDCAPPWNPAALPTRPRRLRRRLRREEEGNGDDAGAGAAERRRRGPTSTDPRLLLALLMWVVAAAAQAAAAFQLPWPGGATRLGVVSECGGGVNLALILNGPGLPLTAFYTNSTARRVNSSGHEPTPAGRCTQWRSQGPGRGQQPGGARTSREVTGAAAATATWPRTAVGAGRRRWRGYWPGGCSGWRRWTTWTGACCCCCCLDA